MTEAVFAAAGRALAQAHRFEHNLKGLAALVHSIHTAREEPAVPVSFSKVSLGPLIDAVRRFVDFDPRLPLLLEEARERRNALCHSYFEDHKAKLDIPEGQAWILEDLTKSMALFDDAADFCLGALGVMTSRLESALESEDSPLTPRDPP